MATIQGTINNDSLTGTQETDTIYGAGGDDSLSGLGGNDNLYGETGNDTVNPGLGYNNAYGGDGDDLLILDYSAGDPGSGVQGSSSRYYKRNSTNNGNLDETYPSNFERFQITGTSQNDKFSGYTGNDTLSGDAGNDTLDGYIAGNDSISGGGGNDSLISAGGIDKIDGGLGNDTLTEGNFASATTALNINDTTNNDITLTDGTFAKGIEVFNKLTTGSGNDSIHLSQNVDNTITTSAGNDTVNAGLGLDRVNGGDGDDLLILDYSVGETGSGLKGDPSWYYRLNSSLSNYKDYVFPSNFERFQITGTSQNDNFKGGSGNDTLSGGGGNDLLISGGGLDKIDGGLGNDSLSDLNLGTVTTSLSLNETGGIINLPGGAEIKGIEVFSGTLTTGSGNDSINFIQDLNNIITTGAGNDTVNAGLGLDRVNGGDGEDLLILDYSGGDPGSGMGGSPTWYYRRNSANNGNLDEIYPSNFERFQITGTSQNDNFQGNIGSDTFNGFGGLDSINGGEGADRFILGDDTNNYYDDGKNTTNGNTDYASISGFQIGQDVIQLKGKSTDYRLVTTTENTELYIDKPGTEPDELVGIINKVTGLNLSSSSFAYLQSGIELQFSSANFSVNENGTAITPVVITRSGGSTAAVTVTVTPSNGSATAPGDYNNTPITISFASSQTNKTVIVPIVNDSETEGNETINLTLSNPTGGAALGIQGKAILTIVDDEVAIADNAGNSQDTARDLGILNGSQNINDYLSATDRDDYYRFSLLKNTTLNLTLNGLAADVNVELIDSSGSVIASSINPGTTAETLNRTLNPGLYYLRVYRQSGQTTYNLSLKGTPIVTPLQITSVSPNSGSSAGETTLTIKGSQFSPNAQVSLISPTGSIKTASKVTWQDDTTVVASFNLGGLSSAAYDVRVTGTSGTATASDIFNVNTAPAGQLETFLSVPSAMRPFWIREATVTYRNKGNTDIPAPLLTLSADNALFYSEETGGFTENSIEFLGINSQGNAGVLPPGATDTYSFKFRPKDNTVTDINFSLNTINLGQNIDWNGLKASLKPPEISAEAWNIIYNNFTAAVGNTTDSYQAVLNENASYLSQLGEYTSDFSTLLGFELAQAENYYPSQNLASTTDAVAPTPGLSLEFGRTYLQAISGRLNLGVFGRGWTHPYDIKVSIDTAGNVTIQDRGSYRFFTKRTDGNYQSLEGDYGTLKLVGGVYQLTEKGGFLRVFRSDGRLSYVQDTDGNKITLGYTGTQLTTLTHSNGDKFTLTYNAQGRINKLTDQAGRNTTYTYDATGQTLLSTTAPDGTTSYSYKSSTLGNKAYALRQITYPDNTKTFFEYDTQGRLVKSYLEGNAQPISYNYDSTGGLTVKDGASYTTKLLLNSQGDVGVSIDPLERLTSFGYDKQGNLTKVIAPGNTISSFVYDSQGNLLSGIDPLGQRVDFSYEPKYDNLATVKDQKGNLTGYTYTNSGNLSSINYTDGSKQTFSYDTLGNLTISVNRRGQKIDYTYDNRGLLLSKKYPDGKTATYTYDNRGNLLTAVDSDSSVTYTYDTADRLTKATQSNGRFVQFTYDAGGRRTKMVDQTGAAVNYSYDTVGRLAKLTNGSGQNIITYTYDAVGRLSKETNGNGTYTTYTYDAASQLTKIINYKADNSLNSSFTYTYDHLGRRNSVTTLEGKTTYGYDASSQLTSVTLPNGRKIEYSYDGAGNRISVKDNGVTTAYSTNNLNQYNQVGTNNYTYDQDGNLVSKTEGGKTYNYTYDTENRLIGVTDGADTWTYEYDALGNRTASIKNGQRTEYLLDPTGLGDVVGEYSGTTLVARYTHGLGLASRTDGTNATSYYDTDAIGSVVGLSNAAGSYVNKYSYLPFGEDLSKTETVANPFEYVGELGVMDEGNGLDFMRARYYEPGTGKFLSADPIGIDAGDANFYRYVFNNPVTLIDPLGLSPSSTTADQVKDAGTGIGAIGTILRISSATARLGGIIGAVGAAITLGALAYKYLDFSPTYDSRYHPKTPRSPGTRRVPNMNYSCNTEPKSPNSPESSPSRSSTALSSEPTCRPLDSANSKVRASKDPNDIIGPAGYGTEGYLTPNQVFPYTVRFENQATATAPAVFVTITHQLDSDLNLNTFELGDFGFGDLYIDVPSGFKSYTERVDLTDTIGYYVDFKAALNTTNRTVTWKLTTIDPETGDLPDDPDAGFLPPNNANHDGEGFVNYSIQPNANLTTQTAIDAKASIVFDTNAPINTPNWRNTVDVNDPTSKVNALPTNSNPNFTVSWAGSDTGSGIANYDVFVSINGGVFTLWQNNVTTTSAIYQGEVGKTYSFYTIAQDNVGNLQAIPLAAQATTTVTGNSAISLSDITVIEGNTTAARFVLSLSTPNSQPVTVQYTTSNGTAISGSDYTGVITPLTATFAANQTVQTISITLINDNLNESDETFTLNLSNPTNATFTKNQATATITDTLKSGATTSLPALVENLTLTGTSPINGTGNAGNNILTGNSANNQLTGLDGNDTLNGGAGVDTLIGGNGNDTYVVDTTTDTITEAASSGTDKVESSVTYSLTNLPNVENLTLTGTGNITGTGNAGNNQIAGNAGNNLLTGLDGSDTVNGGAGVDTLVGGNGNDVYGIDSASDVVTETSTTDTADTIESNITASLASYTNIENLTLVGTGNISATGNSGNNRLTGNSGNNRLNGGAGTDTLRGGLGNDTYVKDTTADSFIEGTTEGVDTIETNLTTNLTAYANIENLTLTGTTNLNGTGSTLDNNLLGNSGVNLLDGGAGNDTLNGGLGNDSLIGGSGNDTYVLDNLADKFTEAASAGTDTIQTAFTYNLSLAPNIENLSLSGTANLNGTGTTGSNAIAGNSGSNLLSGLDGNDTLDGGAGIDSLVGGNGNDAYLINSTTDVITEGVTGGSDRLLSSISYTLNVANVENLSLIGTSNINATGSAGNNSIAGNTGDNRLDGGAGIDTLAGGLGNDTYVVNSTTDVITEVASAGIDTVESSVGFTIASLANLENITLTGTGAINATGNISDNRLTGNGGNNSLTGGDGNDTLTGSAGVDSLAGGLGNDVYMVDTATDVITEAASAGIDTVESSVTFSIAIPATLENITLTGTSAINATGNTLDNLLTGNSGNNQLSGGDGNDTLNGGAGVDTITGGAGNDVYLLQFGQSTVSTPDRVTDFAIGADKIDLLTNSGATLGTPVSLTRAADSTALSLDALATQVFADSDSAATGNQPLLLNSAALAVVTSGAVAGSYLIVNNGVAGFQATDDLVVNITGYTESLPSVASCGCQ